MTRSGFSLVEMVTVTGVLAVLTALAIPPVLSWKQNAATRSSAAQLINALQLARTYALTHQEYVVTQFSSDGYEIFVDNGAGGGTLGDWLRTGNERLLFHEQNLSSVRMNTNFPSQRFRFKGFGRNLPGKITLTPKSGNAIEIIVNVVGRIRPEWDD